MLVITLRENDIVHLVHQKTGDIIPLKLIRVKGKQVRVGFKDPDHNYKINRTPEENCEEKAAQPGS